MIRTTHLLLSCALLFLFSACSTSSGNLFSSPRAPAKSDRFAASYSLDKTRPDPIPARRIVLLHPKSGEKLDVIYFHDGRYDTSALQKIDHLFRDRRSNVAGKIDPELIDYMLDIRTRFGLPPSVPFEILDGYRTRESNRVMSKSNKNVALESFHIHGWAVDFRIQGVDGKAICEIAKTMQRGGVAFYPADNHVHVDLGNIRTWKQK